MSTAHNSKILTQIMKTETFTCIVKHCTEMRNKKIEKIWYLAITCTLLLDYLYLHRTYIPKYTEEKHAMFLNAVFSTDFKTQWLTLQPV